MTLMLSKSLNGVVNITNFAQMLGQDPTILTWTSGGRSFAAYKSSRMVAIASLIFNAPAINAIKF